ncbi:unnamed protein product [Linum tenue]|uniref:Uncharacterized protein n=1 Tax=Linum tenue TaxID=586396 RepID=A0AAV0JBH8_9ROSI|nr:unnamed protein product [Linum tenue]
MPSVVMSPFFEELALTYPDAIFLVVDVDEVKVIGGEKKVHPFQDPLFSSSSSSFIFVFS